MYIITNEQKQALQNIIDAHDGAFSFDTTYTDPNDIEILRPILGELCGHEAIENTVEVKCSRPRYHTGKHNNGFISWER